MASLHAESTGEGPTLALAHGFTQTGGLWGRFGQLVGRGRRVVSVDLPGHGGSTEIRVDLVESAALLVEAGGARPFDLLGYSLGARFALHAALDAPGRIARLILISGTAGIEADDARAERRKRDEDTATRLEAEPDVDAFVASWLAAPMFATLRAGHAGIDQQSAAFEEIDPGLARRAMTGEVDRHHPAPLADQFTETTPQSAGLGEPVGEDQGGAVADRLGVQGSHER